MLKNTAFSISVNSLYCYLLYILVQTAAVLIKILIKYDFFIQNQWNI